MILLQVRELESALRHREELIRTLEEAIAKRESDLSFVLKEKFHLSKRFIASRFSSQSCTNGSHSTTRMSSADTSADIAQDDPCIPPSRCITAECTSSESAHDDENQKDSEGISTQVNGNRQVLLQCANGSPPCEALQRTSAWVALQADAGELLATDQAHNQWASLVAGVDATQSQQEALLLLRELEVQGGMPKGPTPSITSSYSRFSRIQRHEQNACSIHQTCELSNSGKGMQSSHTVGLSGAASPTPSLADAEASLESNRRGLQRSEDSKAASGHRYPLGPDVQHIEGAAQSAVSTTGTCTSPVDRPSDGTEDRIKLSEGLAEDVKAVDAADPRNDIRVGGVLTRIRHMESYYLILVSGTERMVLPDTLMA